MNQYQQPQYGQTQYGQPQPQFEPLQTQQYNYPSQPQFGQQFEQPVETIGPKKHTGIKIFIGIVIGLIVAAALTVGIYFLVKKNKTTSSNATASLTPQTKITSSSIQITEKSGLCLAVNSATDGDYVILVAKNAQDPNQFWTKQIPTSTNANLVQFVNAGNGFCLTINGGLGSIVASKNQNLSNQIWDVSSKAGLILPSDSIYASPSEPVQLVLSIGQLTSTSGLDVTSDQIAAVLQGQIVQSTASVQADLDTASGNTSSVINGPPATLTPQNADGSLQTWTIA